MIIRENRIDDLHIYHKLLSDDIAMRYLSGTRSSIFEINKQKLNESINEIDKAKREKYYLAIEDKVTKEYIGQIGVTILPSVVEETTAGLGYFLFPQFWNRGIVTEAAREVIRFVFSELQISKISCGCHIDNKASERVMLKLGMKKVMESNERLEYELLLKDFFL